AGLGLGVGGTAVANRLRKRKHCPHKGCEAEGDCSQRVCRSCMRLFFPDERGIDCSRRVNLDWYAIASYLDEQKLSYVDAEVLVREHMKDWTLYTGTDKSVFIDCASFLGWVAEHKAELARYKGKGLEGR